MTRRSWHRVVAALLVVTACSLTLPVKAEATSMSMDSVYAPVGKLFNRAMDWLLSLWKPPAGRRSPGINKFGAGQSSDGHASRRAGY